MTADACGRKVLAGPIEATVLGNILVQLLAAGAIESLEQARQIIADSEQLREHKPENSAQWNAAYKKAYPFIK